MTQGVSKLPIWHEAACGREWLRNAVGSPTTVAASYLETQGNHRQTCREHRSFSRNRRAKVQASLSKFTTLAATARFHLPSEIRTTLELVIEDLQLAHSFWRNAAASKAEAIFTAVRFERGVLHLPMRNDEDVQNLASSAWSNGGFPRALSIGPKRD